MPTTTRRNRAVRRVPSQQHGEHKRWRPRATTAAESAGARPSHDEHPGAQDAGQGARREHHQRPADGLKVNRGFVKGAHRCQPHRPRARDGVTRGSEQLFARTLLDPEESAEEERRHVDRRERERKREKETRSRTVFVVARRVREADPPTVLDERALRAEEDDRRTRQVVLMIARRLRARRR